MLALIVIPLLLAAVVPARAERVERRVGTMGTTLVLSVDAGSRAAGLAAGEDAIRAIETVEARLSTWREESELSALNAAPVGQPVTLSTGLYEELSIARQCWRSTGGAFDPAVGPLVQAWDLRGAGRNPSDKELATAREKTDFSSLQWAARTVIKTKPGVVLEEGGFGKGAGLDAALLALGAESGVTGAVLDFGGQWAMLPQTTPISIAIADPDQRSQPAISILLNGGSLSVSGNSERGMTVDGVKLGHLIDPGTGRPAKDFGTVAVWSSKAIWADCLSTALYVMGPTAAARWAVLHPEHQVVLLTRKSGGQLEVTATEGLRERLRPLAPRVRIRYLKSAETGHPRRDPLQ